MNQTQTRSPRKRWLSLLLAVVLVVGLLPISAFASNVGTQADDSGSAVVDNGDFLRIFHLDCGRKYFSVSEIEGIIDQLAENHYTHIQLAFGNDGLRFLLDDMSVTVNGKPYDSNDVKAAIKNGNRSLTSGSSGELSEENMNDIIAYANGKGIQVIPLFNAPGHMYTVANAMNSSTLNMGGKSIKGTSNDLRTANWALDPTDSIAVEFAEALLQKYVTYFASKGSTMFNIGADESHIDSSNYAAYAKMVNEMNAIVRSAKVNGKPMQTLAYNDGIYNQSFAETQSDVTFDNNIVICYWTEGANSATVEYLLEKGFNLLNNSNNWYYVLGDYLYTAWGKDGQWGYNDALNGVENTPVTKMKDGNDYANSKRLLGSILCVWCDAPNQTYDSAKVYNLIKTMAEYNPDYFKEYTAPQPELSVGDVQGVKVSATKDGKYQVILPENGGGTVQLKLVNLTAEHITWTSNDPSVATVNDNGLVTFTGEPGTVTITAQPLSNTNADEATDTYEVTFEVKAAGETNVEPVTVSVDRTSKAYDVTGDNSLKDGTYNTPDGIASYTIATSAGETTATKATSIDSKTEYIIGNGSQYLKLNGSSITSTDDPAQATKWTITSSGTAYTIKSDDYYLCHKSNGLSADTSSSNATWSWNENNGFYYSSGKKQQTTYYLTYSNGWTVSASANAKGQPYIATPGKAGTTVTFKGLQAGTTSVTIGDTTYRITVNEKKNVEIPISIIDYRADGLLFDWTYNPGSPYSDSYRYGLVHTKAVNWGKGDGTSVDVYTNADGNLEVSGTADGVEKIAGTLIQRTGNANTSTKFYPNGTDNDWSRAGLVETQLGTNGMPVYTDAAVRYVAGLLEAGYYNKMDGNCNSVIYDTFVAADGERSVRGESATAFSAQFEVTKSYNDIKTAYDLAWYLLNTIYQPDTEATVNVKGTDGKQHDVPLYGMAVDTYKSIVLTADGDKYTFKAGYKTSKETKDQYPEDVNFDRVNGTISNGGGDTKNLGLYPLDGLGYEQPGLLEDTSMNNQENGKAEHNGNFTLRGESQFVYNKGAGLYFTFTGDDDVYMYINGVLALDLGGSHGRNTKTVQLDKLDEDTYKLKDGEVATFTFFYMERCSDASTFAIETNMELVQRDIAVEKNAYSDGQYTIPVNSGTVVDNGRDLFYDLVVTNKGNTVMTNFTFEDTADFGGKANLGYGVTSAGVTAGSKDKNENLVSLSASGSTYTYFITDANGNQVSETKTVASLEELSTAVAGVELAANQSLHVRFLKATVNVAKSKIISYTNTVKVTASAGDVRLWGEGSHSIYAYNDGGTARTYVVDFGLPLNITNIFDPSAENYINSATGAIVLKQQPKFGTAELTAAGYNSSVVYRLNARTTIDGQDTITLNVPYKFDNAERTLPKTLTIIPASNVYYEDNLASFTDGKGVAGDAKWTNVDNEDKATTEVGGTDVYQALQELGSKKVYGYDDAYNSSSKLSMGTAHKVTVKSAMADPKTWNDEEDAWPTASFTFTGTGFDIISLTNNKSGAIFVDVYAGSKAEGKAEKKYVVNNYYGYTYDEESKTWQVDPDGNNALYQIPVMKITDLAYGEHTVVIKVAYNEYLDTANKHEYSFWLDAIRVYNPMGDEYADYTKDNEGYPQYIKLRDELAKTADASGDKKVVFIDGAASATIAQYANYGPNNEVYLAKGQAISFKLTGDTSEIASIQIGAKAPDGKPASMVMNGDKENAVQLKTATEMYYTISSGDGQFTIANKGEGILSLTNLKITYKTGEQTVTLDGLTAEAQANAVAMVQALFAAPVETFQAERFDVSWGGSVRAGRKATLTVKASEDVDAITVDGVTVSSYTTRTERTGWGWWSPKVTYRVFTYTITATATADYQVCAVNSAGISSEPVIATLTVRPATWWNWWF